MRMSFLSDFNPNLNITTYFRKKTQMVVVTQFHADERTTEYQIHCTLHD